MGGYGQCIRGRRLWKKTKLTGSEDVIDSEMFEDVLVDESFKEFTNDWLKGDRTVEADWRSPDLKIGMTRDSFHALGTLPVEMDKLNR